MLCIVDLKRNEQKIPFLRPIEISRDPFHWSHIIIFPYSLGGQKCKNYTHPVN